MHLPIHTTWNGVLVAPTDRIETELLPVKGGLRWTVDAPFYNDPPPAGPPGSTPGLWHHEVVELMIAGPDEGYIEIELGPFGHYLALSLHGVRKPVVTGWSLSIDIALAGPRWRAGVHLPRSWLPAPPWRVNAFAMHGTGDRRVYLCHHPTLGDAPDFHRLERFVTWTN